MNCPRLVIAGAHSGVGKTSITLGLVSALRSQGLRVQTFKVGPDFLDPSYLALASGRPCYNLDGWMSGNDYVRELFARVTKDADIAVVEGVMGLFDGSDPATSEGSTAEIAQWLDAPVILVVGAHGIARSLAALVKGYCEFEPGLRVAGVIANNCGSERHAKWLNESLAAASLPSLVGAIPRGGLPELKSRHLGLVTADNRSLSSTTLENLAEAVQRYVSIDDLLNLAKSAQHTVPSPTCQTRPTCQILTDTVLGVAQDAAFHFYYKDLFDELEMRGCEVIRFSPLEDGRLPEGLDALYIGGGYPEEHAKALSENTSMLDDIRRFAASDRPLYAECGGLMYLSQGVQTLDGREFQLAGVLPVWTRMLDRKRALGYVEVTLNEDSILGTRGESLRGHEFHYSELADDPANLGWSRIYSVRRRLSDEVAFEGYRKNNVLASYVHLHLASNPRALDCFITACGANKC